MKRNADGASRYKAPPNENWALKDHLCIIYVIAPDMNGPSKIGVTSNVQKRLNLLQNGCWLPLKVYGIRAAFRRDADASSLLKSMASGARRVERLTHAALTECDVRLCGEWFDIDVPDALKAIEVAARTNDCAAVSLEDVAAVEFNDELAKANISQQNRIVRSLATIKTFTQLNG